ncbi:filaggrin [Drosophila willistoni]|uniref:filaggrin n=1 Tax=Drosophila willistoni TaxID=7260 RepID=UPI00017D8EC0|nr:filaggrin [Drosophila willistoni]
MRIKLMPILWLLGFAAAAAAAAASSPSATSAAAPAGAAAAGAGTKLKRDAGLSFGSGLYHGPSHKYLPPSSSSHGIGHGYDYALGLGSSNGYDFGHHLDAVSYQQTRPHYPHQHHHHHQPQQQQQQHHHSSSLSHHPKVETYIVQTSGGSGGSSYASFGHGHGHGQGYKYAAPHSSGGSGGGSYVHLLSSGHKLPGSGTYLLATPTADYYAASHQGYHSRPTSYGTPGRLSLGHSSSLEHQLAAIAGAGDEHHSGSGSANAVSSVSSGSSASGYSYEPPSIPFGKIPTLTTSYGVPLLPGYEHQPSSSHYDESLPEQDLDAELPSHSLHTDSHQTPAYALGHKGLGHFTYTASKPHALNTDIHGYSHPLQHPLPLQLPLALGHHQELSKAPFKPSAFLGAKHEGSSISSSSSNSISGYDYATPTSLGYDYSQPQPGPLYGAPGQSGDSATPIFEPEATYLPPATPTHGYH